MYDKSDTIEDIIYNTFYNLKGEEYNLSEKQVDEVVKCVLDDNQFRNDLQKIITELIDYYIGRSN